MARTVSKKIQKQNVGITNINKTKPKMLVPALIVLTYAIFNLIHFIIGVFVKSCHDSDDYCKKWKTLVGALCVLLNCYSDVIIYVLMKRDVRNQYRKIFKRGTVRNLEPFNTDYEMTTIARENHISSKSL